MKKLKNIIAFLLIALSGCSNDNKNADQETKNSKTPVTITNIETSSIIESINLTAVSFYQRKNMVKANSNGYVQKVFAAIGDHVESGMPLFIIRTKEADAIGKSDNIGNLPGFKGELTISSPSSGILTEITKHANDYVSDGDQLAIIADQNSFVFLLNIPYEQNKFASVGTICNIILPDSTEIKGTISSQLSTIDPASQTMTYVLKTQSKNLLPENLLAVAQLIKSTKPNAQVIDKSCVLTNETMDNFWVMKLINDSTAIKVEVKKGIDSKNKIEIISPFFNKNDRIIKTGNYGLADTASVIIDEQ